MQQLFAAGVVYVLLTVFIERTFVLLVSTIALQLAFINCLFFFFLLLNQGHFAVVYLEPCAVYRVPVAVVAIL